MRKILSIILIVISPACYSQDTSDSITASMLDSLGLSTYLNLNNTKLLWYSEFVYKGLSFDTIKLPLYFDHKEVKFIMYDNDTVTFHVPVNNEWSSDEIKLYYDLYLKIDLLDKRIKKLENPDSTGWDYKKNVIKIK